MYKFIFVFIALIHSATSSAGVFAEFDHSSPLVERVGYGHTSIGIGAAVQVGNLEVSATIRHPIFKQDTHQVPASNWDEVVGNVNIRMSLWK